MSFRVLTNFFEVAFFHRISQKIAATLFHEFFKYGFPSFSRILYVTICRLLALIKVRVRTSGAKSKNPESNPFYLVNFTHTILTPRLIDLVVICRTTQLGKKWKLKTIQNSFIIPAITRKSDRFTLLCRVAWVTKRIVRKLKVVGKFALSMEKLWLSFPPTRKSVPKSCPRFPMDQENRTSVEQTNVNALNRFLDICEKNWCVSVCICSYYSPVFVVPLATNERPLDYCWWRDDDGGAAAAGSGNSTCFKIHNSCSQWSHQALLQEPTKLTV